MRILHVSAGNLYGGVEALMVTQAQFTDLEPGLVHEFAIGFPGRFEDELRAAGATVHRYDPPRLSRPWTVLKARRQFAKLMDRTEPDVVIVHSNWPHAIFGKVALRRHVPLVFWLHDSYDPSSAMSRLAIRTKPDFLIANSTYNGKTSGMKQFPGVPWETNYSASTPPTNIDRDAAKARIRAETGTPSDTVVIVQTSRLERWKGHTQLLAAAALLRDCPNWEIWLTGGVQRPHEQEFYEELKALSVASGIMDRVKFLGQRSDIPEVLAAADIHCQANLAPEPLGLTFVEALYAGLPSVSMRMGGAAEIITESCGLLVEPGDVEGLAASLRLLIEDPVLRSRLGAAGPDRARELSEPGSHLARLHRMLSPLVKRAAPLPVGVS